MEDKDLITIFEEREEMLASTSKLIFGRIHNITAGIDTFLSKTDDAYASGYVTWEEVQYNSEEDLVVIYGILAFEVGATFQISDSEITISNENMEMFKRMIRIGIPIHIVKNNSEKETIDFLETVNQQNQSLRSINTDNIAPPKESDKEFNLDELTDEQRQALMSTMTTMTIVNKPTTN